VSNGKPPETLTALVAEGTVDLHLSKKDGGREEAGEGALEPMQDRLFYVRQHTHGDGSLGWYVLNGHTHRRASRTFKTERQPKRHGRKLQAAHDAVKVRVTSRDDT
jgi:hypothetical protein